MKVESRDFFWSWSYKNHRVYIVLNELGASCWKVSVSLKCLDVGDCGCSSTLPELEEQTFSSAKEALQAAERLAYRHIDENQD